MAFFAALFISHEVHAMREIGGICASLIQTLTAQRDLTNPYEVLGKFSQNIKQPKAGNPEFKGTIFGAPRVITSKSASARQLAHVKARVDMLRQHSLKGALGGKAENGNNIVVVRSLPESFILKDIPEAIQTGKSLLQLMYQSERDLKAWADLEGKSKAYKMAGFAGDLVSVSNAIALGVLSVDRQDPAINLVSLLIPSLFYFLVGPQNMFKFGQDFGKIHFHQFQEKLKTALVGSAHTSGDWSFFSHKVKLHQKLIDGLVGGNENPGALEEGLDFNALQEFNSNFTEFYSFDGKINPKDLPPEMNPFGPQPMGYIEFDVLIWRAPVRSITEAPVDSGPQVIFSMRFNPKAKTKIRDQVHATDNVSVPEPIE
jgi:hypothetical protein